MIQTAFIANAGQVQKDKIGYSDYSGKSKRQKFGTLLKLMLSSSSMSAGHAKLGVMIHIKKDRD